MTPTPVPAPVLVAPSARDTAPEISLPSPERRRQQASWNRVASTIPDLWEAPSTRYYRRREIALLQREIGPLAGLRVLKLDLWNEAVNTRLLDWMEDEGARAHGLDLSHVVARRARSRTRHRAMSLLQADIRELPYDHGSFDLVYTMGTIEHIPEYRQALQEIGRVLVTGGRAVIGVPRRWDPFLRPLAAAALERLGRYPYSPERSFSGSELQREVTAAGLRVTRTTGILAYPGILRMLDCWLHARRSPLTAATGALARVMGSLEDRLPGLDRLGYLLTVVAAKPGPVATSRPRTR